MNITNIDRGQFSFPSFTSTSLNKKKAEQFGNCLFRINFDWGGEKYHGNLI